MKVIAIIRSFNDFDMLLPILDYSLKTKNMTVKLFSINREGDYAPYINYLHKTYSIQVSNLYEILYVSWYRKIFDLHLQLTFGVNQIFAKIRYGNALLRLLLRIIQSILDIPLKNFVKKLNVNDTIIMDSGSETNFPNRSILKYAKKNGIKVNCFVHGYFIFSNPDNTKKGRITVSKIKQKIKGMIKGKRIYANRYLTGPHQKETYFVSSSMGLFNKKKLNKVFEVGIPRYTSEWCSILRNKVFDEKSFNYGKKNKLNVVFFLSHFQYNVIEKEFFNTFEKLATLDSINFVYKPHTRGHLAGIEEKMLSGFNAFEIPSILLSKWADVGILFGSSIGLQLLSDGVPVIIPKFIHTNSTIFEKYKIAIEVDNADELVEVLKKEDFVMKDKLSNENITKFLNRTVYGEMSYKIMMGEFTKLLGL